MRQTIQLTTLELPRPERDFRVANHGSIVTVHPMTAEAQQWWQDHVAPGPSVGNGYAVEPRYLENLVIDIQKEGFII